ncbi:energy transducer TonB family protein [Sphingopyxis terrae]|uniref:energy transducer TonB family protein n=1 Tax=Sphingopyxis terrae TaxID=33052 RepID=UPI000B0F61C9|nr:energy transducer TonB [Sphingopyxis terrae]
MKPGNYRGAQLAAANDGATLFEDHVVFRTCCPDSPLQRGNTSPVPVASPQLAEFSRSYSRYCDQPMDWRTRLFGIAGTAAVIGLVLAAALFTWTTVYQPVRATSPPLTVVELQPLAAPPEPVRNVAPGREQVEKQEAELEPVTEPIPIPLVQIAAPTMSARDLRAPVKIVDPGPAVPETTAPKSVAAPTADRLSNDVRPDWEGLILARLERYRRYPARARAARQQGTVYVRFKMNRSGMVLSSAIVKKSGSYDLDQAALQTLDRAQPLPAIPADRPDVVELTIPVEFFLR